MANHSIMEQLKSQLQIDRNVTGDDEVNAMPDSGNVDAFARKLVSSAEPVNMSLKDRGNFGAEPVDGVVSVISEDEDEFGGNENNRRVAERLAKERARLANEGKVAKTKRERAREMPADSVIGENEGGTGNANNDAVDLSQAPGLADAGGVLGHAEGGVQYPAGGMPGAAFAAAEPAKDGDGTPTDEVGKAEAAKGGRAARGWKPNAG